MNIGCSEFRQYIIRAAAGDLEASGRESLEKHVASCPSCAQEEALFAATIADLRQLTDIPVPRHFFVQPSVEKTNPWSIFLRMSIRWRVAVSCVTAAVLLIGVFAAAQVRVRLEGRAVTLSFGRMPEARRPEPRTAAPERIDTKALQDEIVRVLGERNQNENLKWVRTLRAEIARAGSKWSDQQRSMLATAVEGLEARLDNRIAAAAQTVRTDTDTSLAALYQAVTLDRQQDNAALSARIGRIALTTEAKGSQTDEILDTLLQVADLRLR